jgi:hypothetical protein
VLLGNQKGAPAKVWRTCEAPRSQSAKKEIQNAERVLRLFFSAAGGEQMQVRSHNKCNPNSLVTRGNLAASLQQLNASGMQQIRNGPGFMHA